MIRNKKALFILAACLLVNRSAQAAIVVVDFGDSTQTGLDFYIENDLRFTPVGTFTSLSLVKQPPVDELPSSDGGTFAYVSQGFSEFEATHENQPDRAGLSLAEYRKLLSAKHIAPKAYLDLEKIGLLQSLLFFAADCSS